MRASTNRSLTQRSTTLPLPVATSWVIAGKRTNDKVGVAFVSNGISGDHSRYLQLGGKGFLLGDGTLTYGREKTIEGYYTARLTRGVFASVDLQHITNPGYNKDHGPVFVPSLRLHLEF
jgi:high affinity Mn2+ porin